MSEKVKLEGPTKAWWTSQAGVENFEDCMRRGDGQAALGTLTYTESDMSLYGWVEAGTAYIQFEGLPHSEVIKRLVNALRNQQTRVRAQAESQCRQLEERIQTLLAITHEPEALNEP